MHKTVRMLGAALLLATPSITAAQQTTPVSFGISGGLATPTGTLGDFVSGGYDITGHIWLKPASFRSVILRGDVSYDDWKYKRFGANYRSIGVVGNAIIHPSTSNSSVSPYLLGGLGIFNTKAYTTSSESGTSTNFGLQAGGGIEFRLSGFSTFVEAKFVNAFTTGNNTNWIPISFGIHF